VAAKILSGCSHGDVSPGRLIAQFVFASHYDSISANLPWSMSDQAGDNDYQREQFGTPGWQYHGYAKQYHFSDDSQST